jgi:hypothetical protein
MSKVLSCKHCTKEYHSQNGLAYHMRKHHSDFVRSVSDREKHHNQRITLSIVGKVIGYTKDNRAIAIVILPKGN